MNRAERRRNQIQAKSPTYNVNQDKLSQIIDRELVERLTTVKLEAIRYTADSIIASAVVTLSDEFGFGAQRIERFVNKVNEQFECIQSGTVTVEDLAEWCNNKFGLRLTHWDEV